MILVKISLKNVVRNPARFILLTLSVVVAFFLFTTISALSAALNSAGSNNNSHRIMTTHRASITQPIPVHYKRDIVDISGVENAAHVSWFGGFFQDGTQQLQVLAVDEQDYFKVYPEYILDSNEMDSWSSVKAGLIVGSKVAEKYGWRQGDKVPLTSTIWLSNDTGSFTWDFELVGIYEVKNQETNKEMVFFRHDYFDEARGYGKHNASWVSLSVNSPKEMDKVIQSIDESFQNSRFETKSTSEQVFVKEQAQQLVDMSWVLKIVVLAVFFTILLITSSSMSQSIRERIGEFAMLKSLGFSTGRLAFLVYLEAFLIIFSGAAIGALLSVSSLSTFQSELSSFLPGIYLGISHLTLALVIASVLAAVVTLPSVVKLNRVVISETLRA